MEKECVVYKRYKEVMKMSNEYLVKSIDLMFNHGDIIRTVISMVKDI